MTYVTTPQITTSGFSVKFILSLISFDPEVKKDWFFSFIKVFTTNSSLTLATTVEKFFGFKLLSTNKRSPSWIPILVGIPVHFKTVFLILFPCSNRSSSLIDD